MARQEGNQEFNTFVGGLLTEANPINYPKGFALELDNFILQRNGTLRKRRGLGWEDNSQFNSGIDPDVITTQPYGMFLWKQASKSIQDDDILVVWRADTLDFYKLNDPDDVGGGYLSSYSTTNGTITSVGSFRNNLVVGATEETTAGGGGTTPSLLIFTYNGTAVSAPTGSYINVRDFPGFDIAGLADTTRPIALSNDHAYNLINQGWNAANIAAFKAASVGAVHPSMSDNMNTGLNASTGVFTTAWVENSNTINSRVPGGRYTVDIFYPNEGRTAANAGEGYGAVTALGVSSSGSIVDIAEFNDRAFYLLNKPGTLQFGSAVLCFSRIGVRDIARYGECTSVNDPTARDFNIPLDTDGGHIDISFVGTPIKMIPLKSRIVIFGTKGVFELVSRQDIVRPSDFSIRKVSDEIPLTDTRDIGGFDNTTLANAKHPVLAGESIYYVSDAGINRLIVDPNSNQFVSQNLSERKIQTLLNELPIENRCYMQGVHVPEDRTVRWIYSDNVSDSVDFTKELVYDEVLDSWYTNSFSLPGVGKLFGSILLGNTRTTSNTYPVSDNLIYAGRGLFNSAGQCMRFARYKNTDFIDFESYDNVGTSYEAVLQTGYINGSDTQRYKQGTYIVPSFIRTETGFVDDGGGNLTPVGESSCKIAAWWDYVEDDTFPKANAEFEAYRLNRPYIPSGPADTFDYGQSVITTKNRVTGRGRALSLRFTSEAGYDCRLLGWGMQLGTNNKV